MTQHVNICQWSRSDDLMICNFLYKVAMKLLNTNHQQTATFRQPLFADSHFSSWKSRIRTHAILHFTCLSFERSSTVRCIVGTPGKDTIINWCSEKRCDGRKSLNGNNEHTFVNGSVPIFRWTRGINLDENRRTKLFGYTYKKEIVRSCVYWVVIPSRFKWNQVNQTPFLW